MELQNLAIALIDPSPLNPRKDFDPVKLEELAEDIRARGLLQPVLVRRGDNGRFELVVGHRRLRAAEKAGLLEVPAIERDLSDSEVLETQLVENVQRADLHPMEVAEGYRELTGKHGVTVEDLAQRLGRSKASIYAALKLCDLRPKPQELFRAGRLSASTALLVARIPDGQLQERAAKEIATGRGDDSGPLSFRDAQELVQRSYMLGLRDSPFDTKDALLRPEAGPCSSCPKRTGAQPELFKDVPSADVCTDPPCYQSKVDAWWASKVEASGAGGQKVLGKSESKKVIDRFGQVAHDSGYVKADAVCSDDPRSRTYEKLLGKHASAHVVLARDETGKVHELLPRTGLKDALSDAGHDFKKERAGSSEDEKAAKDARALEKKRKARALAITDKAVAEMVSKVQVLEPNRKFWALMASALDGLVAPETLRRRLGPQPDAELAVEEEKRYLASIPKWDEGQLRGLVFEAVMEHVFSPRGDGTVATELKAAAEFFKVDVAAITAEVKAEEREQGKPKVEESPVERVAKKIRAIVAKDKEERA